MTTTACDYQFSAEPEPVHQPYNVAAILRRNIADLEKELQRQKERAEKAEAKLAGSREDLQNWIESRNGWMDRAHAAEMELKGLLEQVPLTFVHDPNGYALDGKHNEIADALPVGTDLYSRPIPAPAVPEEWKRTVSEFLSSHDAAWAELFKSLPADTRSVTVSNHQADAVRKANDLRALLQSDEGCSSQTHSTQAQNGGAK